MKCERCWSKNDVAEFPTPLAPRASIPLCQPCRVSAPQNPVLFKELFLRFATRKELLRNYDVGDEVEALRTWSTEIGMELRELKSLLADETGGIGLLSSANLLEGLGAPRIPYGYTSQDDRLVHSLLEAEVVRNLFDLYLQGRSLEEIQWMLNKAQVPAPRGGEWHRSTVRYILRNPLYAGLRRWKGTLRESSHPPIVDRTHFERVQAVLSYRCRRPDLRLPTASWRRGI